MTARVGRGVLALALALAACSRDQFAQQYIKYGNDAPRFSFDDSVPTFVQSVCSQERSKHGFEHAWQDFANAQRSPPPNPDAGDRRAEICAPARVFAAVSPDVNALERRTAEVLRMPSSARVAFFVSGREPIRRLDAGYPSHPTRSFDANDPYWTDSARLPAAVVHTLAHEIHDRILWVGRREKSDVVERFYAESVALLVARKVTNAPDDALIAMTPEEIERARKSIRDAARRARAPKPDLALLFGDEKEAEPEDLAGYLISLEVANRIAKRDGIDRAIVVQPQPYEDALRSVLEEMSGGLPPLPRAPVATIEVLARSEPPPATKLVQGTVIAPAPGAVAGQMTPAAVAAKRLFDAEQWKPATNALREVASGRTGDDAGNRELARYHLAIALFRTKSFDESQEVFADIATRPSHLKFRETLLWLAKLAADRPDKFRLSSLSAYQPSDIARFDNGNQRELYFQTAFLLGRQRYAEGRREEAAALFGWIASGSPYRRLADGCLARMRP